MQRERIDITAADGASSKITVFAADPALDAPVLVCMPAMGTAALYYEPLAGPIVREGWRFVTADIRGIGSSSVRVKRGVDFGYREMVELDWPAVVQKARERFPGSAVYLLGHSLDGQLSCLYLAANPSAVAGLVLVAAPSVHWRGWDIPLNEGVLAGTQTACAVARVLGYFPGRRLGFGGSEARGVMRDCPRQARTGRYEPRGPRSTTSGCSRSWTRRSWPSPSRGISSPPEGRREPPGKDAPGAGHACDTRGRRSRPLSLGEKPGRPRGEDPGVDAIRQCLMAKSDIV